jgi:CRISPR-associated exonuclease Cas4
MTAFETFLSEEETGTLAPLSALQHYLYCPRQCALIHLDQEWSENRFTAEGRILHEKADSGLKEKRGSLKIETGVFLRSNRLGLIGKADVVEFHFRNGEWIPYPVEYKRGRPKTHNADRVQLCAQALCLEEMLNQKTPEGSLFYGQTRRREVVAFTEELRKETCLTAQAVRDILSQSSLPPPIRDPKCEQCSLKNICLPETPAKRARSYLETIYGDL